MSMRRLYRALFFGFALLVLAFFADNTALHAQSSEEVERLQNQIENRNSQLADIEAEIAKFQRELQVVGAEKNTLQKAINELELERKKVLADISYTQNRIGATDLEIEKLDIEIIETERRVSRNEEAVGEVLRKVQEGDDESLIEMLLRYENLSEFWGALDELQRVKNVMSDEVRSLLSFKTLLEDQKNESEVQRQQLVSLNNEYTDQRQVLENNKAEKSELLTETANKEANYQALLAEKRAAREKIERELREFESQLQFILDPNTVPVPGTVVFDWPVENVIITQLFGGTEFAKRNASIYGGRAYHPGVDFGVPRGTKIYAPLAGTVRATGNTDLVPGCYSWGKWTLIDHANGLATLYAHQDVISVSPGQQVTTGEVIGYSGNTGYSTGPHVHFTVYAKSGVEIRKFNEIKTVTSCGPATTPVAATEAYLDPMLYLPPA